jgi:membrane-bound ClpP family serine protease
VEGALRPWNEGCDVADTSIVFGFLLAILGLWGFFGAPTDHRSPTALIPTAVGVVLVVLGALARKEALRKHAMHAAAVVGLLGFFAAAGRFLFKLFTDGDVLSTAGLSTATMTALCGVFVVLCVKSFIDARRRRRKAEAEAAGPVGR